MRPRLTLTAAAALAAAVPAAPIAAHAAGSQPHLRHVRLAYIAGQDDPVAVAFSTDKPLEVKANGKTLRGRAGVLGATTSLHHLAGSRTCYLALASTRNVKKLHVGNKYQVTVAIGPDDNETTYHRMATLRRASSLRRVAEQLGC